MSYLVREAMQSVTTHSGTAQYHTSGSLWLMQTHKVRYLVRYNGSLHVILLPHDGADSSGEQLRELQRLLIRMMKVHKRCDIHIYVVKHATTAIGRGQCTGPEGEKFYRFSRDSGGDLRGVGGGVAVLLHLARYA